MAEQNDYLIKQASDAGAQDARCIKTGQIIFDPRTSLKCRFGCKRWGRYWTCPPNLSISQEEFLEAFRCYETALIIQASTPLGSQNITLSLEKEAMISCGCHYAFALVLCVLCEECAYPEPCLYPHLARPAPDAFGIDIVKTIEPLGLQLEFDRAGQLLPTWYSLVLIS